MDSDKKQPSPTESGNKNVQLATSDFEVSFFPEGGNLVEGASCKVAFKALNRNGYSETITGDITDEAGSVITSIQTVHAGMGVFNFIPKSGKRYFLKCRNENGLEKQFELPQVDPRACALTVSQRNGRLTVEVRKPADYPDTPCYLLGHCRGMVFHFSAIQGIAGQARNDSIEQGIAGQARNDSIEQGTAGHARNDSIEQGTAGHARNDSGAPLSLWRGAGGEEGQARNDSGAPLSLWRGAGGEGNDITFPEKELPGGILQFILFDEQMNPLSERLVFSKNYDRAKVTFHTDSVTYQPREKVIATVFLSDSIETLFSGNLSVAVTDDKDIAVDSTTTILSSLLLSSELKGYIENPVYYLQDNPESVTALDYLMLTHGWRRYHIPEVVKGNYETSQFPFQTGQEISGQMRGGLLSKPVSGGQVLITAGEDFELTSTDGNGLFAFKGFEYPDSTSYFIKVFGKNVSSWVELALNEELYPKPTHALQTPATTAPVSKEEINAFIMKAMRHSRYEEGMRVIQLPEVEVTARRTDRKEESRLQYWANQSSDVTIHREEIEKWNPRLVADILRRVSGVRVFSSGYIFIGEMGMVEGVKGLPLVLIDGIPADWPPPPKNGEMPSPYQSPLERVNAQDVESIDVFKGANAAAFGARGANGVISITTRRGIDAVRESENNSVSKAHNYTTYIPLGYQKPVEFYSPKYETLEEKQSTIPDYRTTIFWKPDIVVSDTTAARFEFYTSDVPTTYSVVFEGLTNDGRIVRKVEKIQVE